MRIVIAAISIMFLSACASEDVIRHQGVPGIATYATLTFLNAKTTGQSSCPAN